MKKISSYFYGIIGIGFMAGFLYFLYKMFTILIENINKVNPTIIVAFIAGSVTIIGYFVARYLEKQKTIEIQIREQKLPVYDEFIGFFIQKLMGAEYQSLSDVEKAAEIQDFMARFTQKGLLWFSDDTLLAFINWKYSSQVLSGNTEDDTIESLRILEALLLAFRKDVGHSNKNIKKGDLLSLFVNDIYKYRDKL